LTLNSNNITFKENPAMENALSLLIIAGAFLLFTLGILALAHAQYRFKRSQVVASQGSNHLDLKD
jgi:hypothetical protein